MVEILVIGSLCHAQRFLESRGGKHSKYLAKDCFDVRGNDFGERSIIILPRFYQKWILAMFILEKRRILSE